MGAKNHIRLIESFLRDASFAEAFELLFENASDAIYILDKRGNFVALNCKAEELTGFKREEWIGKSFRKIVSAKNLPKAIEEFLNVIRGKSVRFELELKTAFKKTVLVEVTSKPLIINGKIVGTLGIARDITERKRMEHALRKSEEKFRNIFESGSDAMIFLDRSGKILDVNRNAVEVFGGSKKELLGKHFTKLGIFSLRDVPRLIANFADVTAGKKAAINLRIKNKKGQKIFLECSSSFVRLDDKFTGVMVIARDITERKKTEQALKESEEKFRNLAEQSPNMIFINKKGRVVYANKKCEEIMGYKREEFYSPDFDFFVLVAPESMDILKSNLSKHIKGEEIAPHEYAFITKKGKRMEAILTTRLIVYEGMSAILGIITDITERKQMEKKLQKYSDHLEELVEKRTKQLKEAHKQLLKSERLATIGEIAAMVGHDLRNPLTGIAAATYYLKTKLDPNIDKTAKEMLDLIEQDIEHSSKIISDLLDYSREIHLELTETTPKSIIKDALTLLKVPKNIRILNLIEDEPEIKTDVEKMKRVFINIIKNAIEAMPEGGKLTIKSMKTSSKLETTFADTGTGIPQDILEKIWAPLFTTKAKGIGLGLPICKRIVEAHKGYISVESTVGKGTTFTITIPLELELEGGEKAWLKGPESLLSTTTKA